MKVLKTNDKQTEFKVVGASLPLELYNYLSLYGVAMKVKKTTIIRELLEGWMEEQNSKYSESYLLNNLTERIRDEWNNRRNDKGYFVDYSTFLNKVTEELSEKGMDKERINSIIKRVQDDDKKRRKFVLPKQSN